MNQKINTVSKSKTKIFYWSFIQLKQRTPTCVEKWSQKYPDIDRGDWADIFYQAFKVTRETQLQSFQYKIIHRLTN